MGEAKPTPGEWRAKQLGGYENPGWVILWPDKGGTHMRRLDYQGNFTESDARLIAEAGTVFHTTGLTPSQLVERVKELEEACKHCEDLLMRHEINCINGEEIADTALAMLRAALSKARPNTAEPQDVAYAELPQADSWVHFYPQFGEAKLRDFADRTHAMRASVTTNACGEPVAHSELFEYLRAELSAIPCRYRGDPSYDHDAYWMRDKVEKLIDEAELIFPTASLAASAGSEPVAPEDYVPMLDNEGRVMVGTSHHYTAENIRALVEEYKALEAGAPEALERYSNSDHRTRAGVLWRVISALADEVPLAAAKEPSP